jgi:malate synthase
LQACLAIFYLYTSYILSKKKKGKAFVFYVPKKSISLSHALLILIDIFSNVLGIVADSLGMDRGSVNLIIHVSHLLQE